MSKIIITALLSVVLTITVINSARKVDTNREVEVEKQKNALLEYILCSQNDIGGGSQFSSAFFRPQSFLGDTQKIENCEDKYKKQYLDLVNI